MRRVGLALLSDDVVSEQFLGRLDSVNGVRIHYLEQGQAPPIVLIYGNGVMAEAYRLSGLFDRLAHQHRIVVSSSSI